LLDLNNIEFPTFYWNSWSCTYFAFLCLLLCAFMTCIFTRIFFIGSGLDLNLFHIWFLMFSLASSSFRYLCEHLLKLLRLAKRR
jgi:hypothetical protein